MVDIKDYLDYTKSDIKSCHKKKFQLQYVDVEDYDDLKPLQYTLVVKKSKLTTFSGGVKETTNNIEPGSFVVCNKENDKYAITPKNMKRLYSLGTITTIDQPRKCVKVSSHKLKKVYNKKSIKFKAPWGEDMIANNNDYLILDGDSAYRIRDKVFNKTYTIKKTQNGGGAKKKKSNKKKSNKKKSNKKKLSPREIARCDNIREKCKTCMKKNGLTGSARPYDLSDRGCWNKCYYTKLDECDLTLKRVMLSRK